MKTTLFLTVLTAVHLHFAAAGPATGDYVAHEWGTFTSVQGADGIQLAWNPLVTSDLPGFVHNPAKLAAERGNRGFFLGKDAFVTLQRMETPVIYFYSDKEQTVDVTVNFPQGRVTEWFPRISPPANGNSELTPTGPRVIRWNKVNILPKQHHAALTEALPFDKSGSHYFAARETDADFLQFSTGDKSTAKLETEKFLFYRGVGDFTAPLTVTQSNDSESFTLKNTGKEELRHLFVYRVHQGQGKFLRMNRLAAGASETVKPQSERNAVALANLRTNIARNLQQALVKEGLYEREASAMVKTWDDSWFAEQGVRVLYVLPREWTDRTLPLTLEPKPREVVRVMVGRAEMITPTMEWDLMKQMVRFTENDESLRARAIEETRNLGLGRFLEPATRRLNAKMPSREFNQISWALLQEASKPVAEGRKFAAR